MESQPQNPEFRNTPKNFHPHDSNKSLNNMNIQHPGYQFKIYRSIIYYEVFNANLFSKRFRPVHHMVNYKVWSFLIVCIHSVQP